MGLGEALHHRQHLAARSAVSVKQEDAALAAVAPDQPCPDLLAARRFQAVPLHVGPCDLRRGFREGGARAVRKLPGNRSWV